MCPARCRLAMPAAYDPVRCLEIAARPGCEAKQRGGGSAPEMVVLRGEVERPPGMFHGPAQIAQQPAHRPARCTAIAPGRRRNSSSSTTTIPAEAPARAICHTAASSHRSASRRRASTPSSLPARQQRSRHTRAEHRPAADQLVGERLEPAQQRGLLSVLRSAGTASSIRSAALAKSSAASAWRIASDGSPFCSYQALARRCRSGTWSGCSSSRCACSTSAKRWW